MPQLLAEERNFFERRALGKTGNRGELGKPHLCSEDKPRETECCQSGPGGLSHFRSRQETNKEKGSPRLPFAPDLRLTRPGLPCGVGSKEDQYQ